MEAIEQAVYDTVHKPVSKSKELALRLGVSNQILLNKVSPTCDHHKLGLLEAVSIMVATGDRSIYNAIGRELDANQKPHQPKDVVLSVLEANKENGDINATIQKAMADGRIDKAEKRAICSEIQDMRDALDELEASVESACELASGTVRAV